MKPIPPGKQRFCTEIEITGHSSNSKNPCGSLQAEGKERAEDGNNMRILTWNVAHQTRTANKNLSNMAEALASLSPDIIVLTEYVEGVKHDHFVSDLKEQGFPYYRISERVPRQNQVFIASRMELNAGSIPVPLIPDAPAVPSNMLHVSLPENGVEILGLRLPAFDDPARVTREKRNAWWDWVLATARKNNNCPFIILGDFNTDPGYPNADGKVRFTQFKELGWTHALPDSGASWWGRTKTGEYERKLDHVLLSRHFTLNNARYCTESGQYTFTKKEGAMSDHAVLIVDIDLKQVS